MLRNFGYLWRILNLRPTYLWLEAGCILLTAFEALIILGFIHIIYYEIFIWLIKHDSLDDDTLYYMKYMLTNHLNMSDAM